MKKKVLGILLVVLIVVGLLWCVDLVMTSLIEGTNLVCEGQSFSSVSEAIAAWEAEEREIMDSSLDVCPPYEVVYAFEYESNTIVLVRYRHDFDGAVSKNLWAKILKHNADGSLSFDSSSMEFEMEEISDDDLTCFYGNIDTAKGRKSISLLYLPADSDKEVYVDGHKAEKLLVELDGEKFYLCYAISDKDTFLSNLVTPMADRHKLEYREDT